MGAGGSKAAAAHKAASRAAAAAAPRPPPAAAPQAAAAAHGGVSEAERQRDAALAQQLAASAAAPLEQKADTEALVGSMNQLMAGMRQYQYELYRSPETDRKYALKRKSKEEKEAELVGRLQGPALRQLLEEHAWSVRRGAPLPTADLARQYGCDQQVLEQVLQWYAAPIISDDGTGRMVGSWPAPPGGSGSSGDGGSGDSQGSGSSSGGSEPKS